MKILFTGASSFTGFWFVQSLLATGHEVTATFTKAGGSYDGVYATRMSKKGDDCEIAWGTSFGDCFFHFLPSRQVLEGYLSRKYRCKDKKEELLDEVVWHSLTDQRLPDGRGHGPYGRGRRAVDAVRETMQRSNLQRLP